MRTLDVFTQQLQLLLESGIPLTNALTLIENASHHHTMKKLVSDVRLKILSGASLSEALSAFPQYFDHHYCQIIAAGESCDQLGSVLLQLIHQQEQQRH